MAKRIIGSTPKADGYRMPAEFEPQDGVWMLWPERNDNWRSGAKPAQETFCQVARAIARFEKVTMCVSAGQYQNARARLPEEIRVVEVSSNDAWVRDCGPTFLVNGQGGLRAVDWTFNAWGGLYDGLYFPWDRDDQVAQKICEMADVDSYRTEGFVLEGGSIHVDGEGTLLTTEMCLLSAGRNPHMTKGEIEEQLKQDVCWQRPTWKLGERGVDPSMFSDPLGIKKEAFGESDKENPFRPERSLRADPAVAAAAGVLELAFPLEIKNVRLNYKRLAKRYHPDSNGGNKELEEKFKDITEAYRLIISVLNVKK